MAFRHCQRLLLRLNLGHSDFGFPIAHNWINKNRLRAVFVFTLAFKFEIVKIVCMFNAFKISKLLLFAVPLMIVIVTSSTLFPFIVGKYVYFRILVDLAFIFFLLGLLFNQQESAGILARRSLGEGGGINQRFKQLIKNPLVIAVSVFIFIFLLSGFFGVDPQNSFWSNFERGEGGLQLLHFYIFFALLAFLFDKEKDWRIIFTMMLIGGVGMAFYGASAGLKYIDAEMITRSTANGGTEDVLTGNGGPIYQLFKWAAIGPSFSDPGYRFQGTIGNSAYVAAYAIFMLFYSAYLLISKYKDKLLSFGAWVLWALMAIFSMVFLAAATRGAFLGLIAAMVAFLAYLAFSSKRWRKWLVAAAIILVALVIVLIQFKNASFIKASPISRILDISFTTKTFHDRTTIWKMAIDGFKERPVLGWGPENFLQVFDRHFNPEYFAPSAGFGSWFDRAHNIYLDYLAETGILGLLSYLSIFVTFYYLLFRKTPINADSQHKSAEIGINQRGILINALMFAVPVAYLVQGIVLFDVSPIYLNLFLLFAFAVYKFQD